MSSSNQNLIIDKSDKISRKRGDLIIELHDAGWSLEELAELFNITKQRVLQIYRERQAEKVYEADFTNSEDYILTHLISSHRRDLQIIGHYWLKKGYVFETKKQLEKSLKRELRPAQNLVPYSDERILQVMNWLDKHANFKWTLETVFKYINEDLEELEAKQKYSKQKYYYA